MSEMIVSPVVIVDTGSSNPEIFDLPLTLGIFFTTQVT